MTGHDEVASDVLDIVLPFRRMISAERQCDPFTCAACRAPHLSRIREQIREGTPVCFVLPGFPGKSPNLDKVLGPVPDRAEEVALAFLDGLCRKVASVYPPGARIVICSDGRVFGDQVGIPDEDITLYQAELRSMISRLGAGHLDLFNLDNLYGGMSHDDMRRRLDDKYGGDLARLRADVAGGGPELALYRGITRFLFEDAGGPTRAQGRAALQRDCRRRAYQVILRSHAWSAVVGDVFPYAVRLSIHPQPCGSAKLGIRLVEAEDNWLTPWHGVAVSRNGGYTLMKRVEAEKDHDTRLCFRSARPYEYVLAGREPHASDVEVSR
ncbi:isocyanide synthase family protein [Actinocrispum sp. NPDC049592]|uniref:isocyanide synthase family protein n=1 Tax=Actinocrispum sp. NPDC049592 TaxID=3154835 RepID=UPI0034492FCD